MGLALTERLDYIFIIIAAVDPVSNPHRVQIIEGEGFSALLLFSSNGFLNGGLSLDFGGYLVRSRINTGLY